MFVETMHCPRQGFITARNVWSPNLQHCYSWPSAASYVLAFIQAVWETKQCGWHSGLPFARVTALDGWKIFHLHWPCYLCLSSARNNALTKVFVPFFHHFCLLVHIVLLFGWILAWWCRSNIFFKNMQNKIQNSKWSLICASVCDCVCDCVCVCILYSLQYTKYKTKIQYNMCNNLLGTYKLVAICQIKKIRGIICKMISKLICRLWLAI